MNLLRHYYKCRWDTCSWFLDYLRDERIGAYTNGFTGRRGANPYAYGTVLEFDIFEAEIKRLFAAKSIKKSRLETMAERWKSDINSPIVVLSGLTLERLLVKL